MIFEEGILLPYSTLRTQNPSIYNLEELYYKVLQLTLKKDGTIWLRDKDVSAEDRITVNFPEFLDVANNMNLIKSVHFAIDASLNQKGKISHGRAKEPLKLLGRGNKGGFADVFTTPLPPDLIDLYIGYRHAPVLDPRIHLKGGQALACKQLSEMEDDCFTWLFLEDRLGIKQKTNKTSVLKFKVEVSVPRLKEWLDLATQKQSPDMFGTNKDELDFNLILHPPYMGRMSFKNSIKIIYPLQSSRIRVIDKVTFKSNNTLTTANKIYNVLFIDKETEATLFEFNSVTDHELFTPIKNKLNTLKTNSYFDTEIESFVDSVLVNFEIPVPAQTVLAKHRNYKIRITARDLTTQER